MSRRLRRAFVAIAICAAGCDDPAVLQLDGRLARPAGDVRRAYEIVEADAALMDRIPCFCGCEHFEHKAVSSCFVKKRDAGGKVTAWDYHGSKCALCIDVVLSAHKMQASGAPYDAIRATLERRYQHTGKTTPTPR